MFIFFFSFLISVYFSSLSTGVFCVVSRKLPLPKLLPSNAYKESCYLGPSHVQPVQMSRTFLGTSFYSRQGSSVIGIYDRLGLAFVVMKIVIPS